MWKCPICKTDNQENRICVKCGFDDSLNYPQHKTVMQLPDAILQQFVKEVKEQSVVLLGENDMEKSLKKINCIYCNNEWYVDKTKKDKVKVCPFCKKEVEEDYTFKILMKLLVEEEGLSETTAVILTNNLKKEILQTKSGAPAIVISNDNSAMKNQEKFSGEIDKDMKFIYRTDFTYEKKFTYEECKRSIELLGEASAIFAVPEGYTNITRQGLEPVKAKVEELRIPKSLRYIHSEELKKCWKLKKIIVHPENEYFELKAGALIYKKTNTILWGKKR